MILRFWQKSLFLPQRNFLGRFKMTGRPFNRNVESTPRRQTLANKATRVIKKQKQLENYPQPATVTDYDSSRETSSPNCQRLYQHCTFFLVALSYFSFFFFFFYRHQPKRKRTTTTEATTWSNNNDHDDNNKRRVALTSTGAKKWVVNWRSWFAAAIRVAHHARSPTFFFLSINLFLPLSPRMPSSLPLVVCHRREPLLLSLSSARSFARFSWTFLFSPVPRTTKPSESNCVEPRSPLLVRSDYDDPSTTVSSSSFDLWITDNRIRSYSLRHEQSPPPPFDRPAEPVFYERVSMIIVAKPCRRLVFTFFYLLRTTSKWCVVGQWTRGIRVLFPWGVSFGNCSKLPAIFIAVKFLKDESCLFKTKMVDFDAFMGNLQSCKYRRIRVIRKITVLLIILSE